ncbi:MAG: hypothetical protein U9N59_10415 [Campylobacterota bacterium]|nr:hypothetical protein [Campylobacterota bacterium]
MEVSSILIGGAIGFMSAIAKDFLLENKKSKEKKLQFKKEKLEEIFLLVGRISKEVQKPASMFQTIGDDGSRLGMILRFYFPTLHQEYLIFLKDYMLVANATMQNKIPDQNDMIKFNKSYQVFLEKLVNESNRLNC